MPVSLSELSDLSTSQASMIEDYTSISNAYSTQPKYNSNDTAIAGFNTTPQKQYVYKNKITSYAAPPKQYIRSLNKQQNELINVYVPPEAYDIQTPKPRSTPLNEVINEDRKMNPPQVGEVMYPSTSFPGSTPPMQDALINDIDIEMGQPMKEYYKPMVAGQSCIDTLNHVMSCPLCSRYFKCDNKVYHVVIIMMILLFAIIMFFCYKDERLK